MNSPEARSMNKRFISTSFRITFVVCWNCFLPCARKQYFDQIFCREMGKRKYLDFPKDESINLDRNRYSWCRPPLKRTKKMARDWKYFLLSLIGGLGTLAKKMMQEKLNERLRIYRQFTNRSYAYNLLPYHLNKLSIPALLAEELICYDMTLM